MKRVRNPCNVERSSKHECPSRGRRTIKSPAASLVLLFLLAPLLLPGCGRNGKGSYDRVIHLDPRLSDGRSVAEVLSRTRRVIASQEFDGAREAQGDWRIANAQFLYSTPGKGIRVKRSGGARGPAPAVKVEYMKAIRGWQNYIFEIDLLMPVNGVARMVWRIEGDPDRNKYTAPEHVKGSPEYQTVRFAPAYMPIPMWYGMISSFGTVS